jgi:PAS domain S-box-containing protein
MANKTTEKKILTKRESATEMITANNPENLKNAPVEDIIQLIQELRVQQTQLEKEVNERTAKLITANQQLQKELDDRKRAEDLLRIQRDLGIKLSSTRDLTKSLGILLDTVLQIDTIDCGGVYLVEDNTGSLILVAHKGLPLKFVESVAHFSTDSSQAHLVRKNRPFYGLYSDFFPCTSADQRQDGLKAIAVIPVKHEKQIVAAFKLASHTHEKIPRSAQNALEAIATQIGAFISRMKADEKLRESEEKYRGLFEKESDAVMIFDTQTLRFEDANRAALDLYGYSKEEFLALTVEDISNEKDKTRATVQEITKINPESYRVPIRFFRKKDGTVFSGEISAATFISKGRKKIIGAVRDITDRKRTEQKIHTLTHELIKAQETERFKIARYLHDQVAQDLSTLKIGCETLFDNQTNISQEIKKKVSEMSQILQGSITAVRDLSYDLRPPEMDYLGLARTIFQYCEEFSKNNGIQLDFYSAGMDDLRFEYDMEINLYRLIQEALNNVKQHANATLVTVRLVSSYPNIILRIEDNGVGFDVEGRLIRSMGERRMGLGSMQERVSLLNGHLKIQSRQMEGTKIFIEVPIREKKSGSKKKNINR